ncbi:response regulator transcription factor [Chamaesiphon sp. VAR_48_metabat_135_sub]|uniref:response regulator transcription factor n=1 Tax=Chamaesiphon sp. VAR_48_metabat_135_sub TaxID=2964699 RepID=UPI00286A8499|nr:response regulator transcription factor [Chamaesiphon sp. VAR_48_metabat_135_sub]
MSTIRILLIEDDELFRLGLSTRLMREADLTIAAEAEDGETAIELVKTDLSIDIAILDIGLPGIDGLETCHQMRLHRPNLRILVLTSNDRSQSIEDLIAANVNGYCLKGMASDSIVLAIRSIMAGASWWDNTASHEIFSAFREPPKLTSPSLGSESTAILTKREQEILALISIGKSNQEIATTLYIAAGTVRVHVHTILSKLGVRDRTQAAILAIKDGLVDPHLLK